MLTSQPSRTRYAEQRVFVAVVAACCTGFMQWGDELHYWVRPLLARRLRLRASTDPMSFGEWRDMVLIAICSCFTIRLSSQLRRPSGSVKSLP